MEHPSDVEVQPAVREQLRSRRRLVVGFICAVLLAAPWLCLIPMGVWRGVAVIEPCDSNARQRYGDAAGVYAVRGAERVRLLPPAWECTLTNGETESVGFFG